MPELESDFEPVEPLPDSLDVVDFDPESEGFDPPSDLDVEPDEESPRDAEVELRLSVL